MIWPYAKRKHEWDNVLRNSINIVYSHFVWIDLVAAVFFRIELQKYRLYSVPYRQWLWTAASPIDYLIWAPRIARWVHRIFLSCMAPSHCSTPPNLHCSRHWWHLHFVAVDSTSMRFRLKSHNKRYIAWFELLYWHSTTHNDSLTKKNRLR